ncbi:hypothetical protein ACQCT3_00870 [Sutcliffiella horikoshii]|uniref:hypothetical protein n=1 Tax=Sutcliffiella horikoshii TaxID=79883 RepID=UPI003CF4A09D
MHKLEITGSERFILQAALTRYMKWLGGMETKRGYVPYARVAFRKLAKEKQPLVDGGEMIMYVDALRSRANVFYGQRRLRDSEFLHELAKKIDLQRQYYQYTNGPKIEKSS